MKALFSAPKDRSQSDTVQNVEAEDQARKMISGRKAITVGFLTNALNPKAVIFFTAVFTQFISPETPFFMLVLYGLTSIIIEFGWFAMMAVILTNAHVKRRFMRFMGKIERACGGLMVLLGIRLAL